MTMTWRFVLGLALISLLVFLLLAMSAPPQLAARARACMWVALAIVVVAALEMHR